MEQPSNFNCLWMRTRGRRPRSKACVIEQRSCRRQVALKWRKSRTFGHLTADALDSLCCATQGPLLQTTRNPQHNSYLSKTHLREPPWNQKTCFWWSLLQTCIKCCRVRIRYAFSPWLIDSNEWQPLFLRPVKPTCNHIPRCNLATCGCSLNRRASSSVSRSSKVDTKSATSRFLGKLGNRSNDRLSRARSSNLNYNSCLMESYI